MQAKLAALVALLTLFAGPSAADASRHHHRHHAHQQAFAERLFSVATFPLYENPTINDCSFAAAADWLIEVHHIHPSEAEIHADYLAAGGTAIGLSAEQMFTFWETTGIDNTHYAFSPLTTLSHHAIDGAINRYGALIAELSLSKGEQLGGIASAATSRHMVIVDGYIEPDGLLVGTWGQQLAVAWEQWSHDLIRAWVPA